MRSRRLRPPSIGSEPYEKADTKWHQFAVGAALVGGWMGLVAGGTLIIHSIFWRRRG
jgi:hypothetical protein